MHPDGSVPVRAQYLSIDYSPAAMEARTRLSKARWRMLCADAELTPYCRAALGLWSLGWTPVPQDNQEGHRAPLYDCKPSAFFDRGMTAGELADLVSRDRARYTGYGRRYHSCGYANTALILKDVVVIDIDVLDEEQSLEIERLVEAVLGPTSWKRSGNAPKLAMFYYHDPEDAELVREVLRTIKLSLGGEVEILTGKSLLTGAGRHHKTLKPFYWSKPLGRPEDLPRITREQLEVLQNELRRRLAPETLVMTRRIDLSEALPSEIDGYSTPAIHHDGVWTRRDGLIVDGREKFARHVRLQVIRSNPAQSYADGVLDNLARVAFAKFTPEVERTGRWASDDRVMRELRDGLRRDAEKMASGGIISIIRPKSSAPAKTVAPKAVNPFNDVDDAFTGFGDDKAFAPPVSRDGKARIFEAARLFSHRDRKSVV